ncbi:CHAT domain-containing protein [Winogradskyella forsetii]|uniref:CHAT domain-containing protein n=1 Tax=Winogradskyella forsetii TaxID=2686077 RepID=UPI0015BD7E79|nr:CHAT domain-containing protein [Winogradskyella forsetii]
MKNEIFKISLAVFLLLNINCFSQGISPEFRLILNDSILTVDQKDSLFQNLLKEHKSHNAIDLLIGDSYEIVKWYRKQGWLSNAIALNKENLKLMESIDFANKNFYRRNLYSLGYYQRKNDSLNKSIKTLKKLLIYTTPDKYAIQGAFQIAEVYFIRDQYYLSKDFHNLSKALSKNLNNPLFIIRNAIGIAQVNKRINTIKSLNEGVKILKEAIYLAESLNNNESDSTIISDYYLHDMYNQLGNLYIDRTDFDLVNGKINLEIATEIAEVLNDSSLLYKTYNDLGVLNLKAERKEAEYYFLKALEHEPISLMKSIINRNLSIHYLNFNNYNLALIYIQNAIIELVNLDTSNSKTLPSKVDLSNSKEKFQIISSLIDKANIWIKLGEHDLYNKKHLLEAIKTLELADFLIEKVRLENVDRRSKLFWQKTATEIYLKATKTCFLLNNPKKAFYFIEKNKALLLHEDVVLKTIKDNSKIPKPITQREQELKHNVNKLEKLANTKNGDSIQNHLLLAKDNYNIFINSLDPDYKLYFRTLQPIQVIDIDTLRKRKKYDNYAFIEYILDDEEGYGIVITKSNLKLFKIKNCKKLKTNVIQYRNLVDKPINDKISKEHYRFIANEIYTSLFPYDIDPLVINKALIIVPDYYLQNIPFESLITSKTEDSFLIHKNQISYAYSLSFLSENNNTQRENGNNIVAFAPVDFSSGLTSLPNTEQELKLLDNLFNSKLYLKDEATKEHFINESKNAKILHIASHANANDSISPWISLHSAKINLDDIYNLKNSAELVVLSACNTSLGELFKGEGIMSLSRGFFYAGSQSVMPTLWEINDKASTELLDSFYKNLKLGQDKSLALHNAKLNYIKTNSMSEASPYYWASFVLIGDTGKIEIKSNTHIIYYFSITFIILITILFYFKYKKTN